MQNLKIITMTSSVTDLVARLNFQSRIIILILHVISSSGKTWQLGIANTRTYYWVTVTHVFHIETCFFGWLGDQRNTVSCTDNPKRLDRYEIIVDLQLMFMHSASMDWKADDSGGRGVKSPKFKGDFESNPHFLFRFWKLSEAYSGASHLNFLHWRLTYQ